MNYLVTGTGFVGRNILEFLVNQPHEKITTTDIKSKPSYLDNERFKTVTFIQTDLADKKGLEALFKEPIDTIFHTAALFNFFASYKQLYKANVLGTRNLCEFAANASKKQSKRIRMINWSSGAVYGNNYPSEITEDCCPHPEDNYSNSKYLAELEAQKFSSDLEIITIRPAAIYGPYSKYGDAKVLYLLKKGILFALPFKDARNTHAHVNDVVGAAFFLSNVNINDARKQSSSLIYNIADDTPYPTSKVLSFAYGRFKKKPFFDRFPNIHVPNTFFIRSAQLVEGLSKKYKLKPLFERDSVDYLFYDHIISNRKIKELGYQFKYPDTLVGLKETIDWYESKNWAMFTDEEKFLELIEKLYEEKQLDINITGIILKTLLKKCFSKKN